MTTSAPVSERWLLLRYRTTNDPVARERLVEAMMPLVRRLVSGYGHPRHREDLLQAACLGLTKAIDRWDPLRGPELRTYAIPTMHGEVRRWLRDHSWAIHVPRPLQERVLTVTRATSGLRARDGRSPTAGQIAEHLTMPLEDVLGALQAGRAYGAASLEAPLGGDPEAGTLGDVIGDEDERLDRAEQVASLSSLRDLLDDRDREVLRLRFVEDLTQSEIADRIGCSQMQVSRLLRRSIDRLSARVTATGTEEVGAVAAPGS
ncbi:sigma-70 family RNA polymerase sigma factor [Capillimicrobium parvum]|uniref:RNA polymerase sigma factor SigF n=1 Tax=Capillimicrobium parvum TaxID=2884022 RepID=A0A9E7C0Q2_9ACTN|nr:sigma-70 family RNA polymerase sigma factor [Capillimicrobium parvum]UGS36616.1 RNA polymerase sigma factor SigF [Capillimicrobium parvum]